MGFVPTFYDIYGNLHKIYFLCQNPTLCDGKVLPGSEFTADLMTVLKWAMPD